MRVLWFTNVPLPEMAARAGGGTEGHGGHWISELFRHVSASGEVELGIATAFPGLDDVNFRDALASYFVIGQKKRAAAFGESASDIARCTGVIEAFQPDLIHFHGSERFYGLVKVQGRTRVPAVVSMQGLLVPYSTRRNFFGALSAVDIVRSTRVPELLLGLGLPWQYVDIQRGARREARILAAVEGVLGRTDWDRDWARRLSPQASYHHVGEIMRPAFTRVRWRLQDCERHSIVFTNAGHPRRGTENLLAAVATLRKEFPDIRVRLAGVVSQRSGYGRFLRRRVARLGLAGHVEFPGYMDETAMARELCRAHVFAITSYVENSPNSLAEAMLIGTPCVASSVGGIPSMVDDGRTGLLYPVDDVDLLAERIRTVFKSDERAIALGRAAQLAATERHDPGRVVSQLLHAYRSVASQP